MAFGIAILVCSVFLLDHFKWLVPSVYLRAILCVLLAALPATDEIQLYFVNLLWYLAILGFLLVLMGVPRSTFGKSIYIVGWLVLMLSTPATILFLPCLAVRAWLVKEDRVVAGLACVAIIVGILPLFWIGTDVRAGVNAEAPLELIPLTTAFVNNFAMRVLVTAAMGDKQSHDWFYNNAKANLGYLSYVVYLIINLCMLIPALRRRQYGFLLIWAYCTYVMLASVGLALIRSSDLVDWTQQISGAFGGQRYFVLALAAFYALIFWWIATISSRNLWLNLLRVILVGVVLTAVVLDFGISGRETDDQWSLQVRRIHAVEAGNESRVVSLLGHPAMDWATRLQITPTFSTSDNTFTFSEQSARGVFDFAGSEGGDTHVVSQDDAIYASGWALNPQQTARADEVILIEKDVGIVLARTTMPFPRDDVAQALGDKRLVNVGWRIQFPADILTIGTHRFAAYVVDQHTMHAFPILPEQVVHVDYATSETVDKVQAQSNGITEPIIATQWVRQEFVAARDGLVGVAMRMGTYGRSNTGPLTFYLQRMDDRSKPEYVASMTIDAATVKDGEDVLFRFDRMTASKGHRYAVVIAAPQATKDNAVVALLQTGDPYPQGQLTVGGKPQSADLTFSLVYAKDL